MIPSGQVECPLTQYAGGENGCLPCPNGTLALPSYYDHQYATSPTQCEPMPGYFWPAIPDGQSGHGWGGTMMGAPAVKCPRFSTSPARSVSGLKCVQASNVCRAFTVPHQLYQRSRMNHCARLT